MGDFQLLASDGITPVGLDWGQLYEGIPSSWRTVILKNTTGHLISGISVECSDYGVQFTDDTGRVSFGLDGIVPTQTGRSPGELTAGGSASFLIRTVPVAGVYGLRTFSVSVVVDDETGLSLPGSYSVVPLPLQPLIWTINVVQANYPLPHFDEDGTPNNSGLYIEDPDNPGSLILDPNDGSGNYPDLTAVLATAGVEFV